MKNLAAALFALVAGCTTTDASFHVQGRVAGTTGVTDVVATTPGHVAVSRVSSPIARDGSFDLALPPGHAWVLVFADATRTGADMLIGTLAAGTLDELAPRAAGTLDLGSITLDQRRATASIGHEDLIAALGMDAITAARIGAADDLATRYANPDIDANHMLDALEDNHDYRIDLHGELHPTAGSRDLTIDDLVRGTALSGVRYLGTGIQVSAPVAAMAGDMSGATMTFEQPFFGSAFGPATTPVDANTPVGQPDLKTGLVDGHPAVGVYGRPGGDFPHGDYLLDVGGTALTFVDVRTATDHQLATGTGMVAPSVRIVPREPTCVTDCAIERIEYRWLRQTTDGWLAVEPGELATMHANLQIVATRTGPTQYLGYELSTQPTGSFDWQSRPASTSGISIPDLAGLTTGQICYLAVNFDDEIGMRMTSYVANPSLACAGR